MDTNILLKKVCFDSANAGDLGSTPGLGRPSEKEMATHSSILAWKIPWMKERGRLQSMGSQTVDTTERFHFHFLFYLLYCPTQITQFSSVQFSRSVMSDSFETPWIAARQASLSITNSRSSLRLTSIESVMPSSHLILCRPLLLLPAITPSIRVFSNESTLLMRWPKYWSFSFSIIPSKEIPGLISFRMDWLDLLALKSLLIPKPKFYLFYLRWSNEYLLWKVFLIIFKK